MLSLVKPKTPQDKEELLAEPLSMRTFATIISNQNLIHCIGDSKTQFSMKVSNCSIFLLIWISYQWECTYSKHTNNKVKCPRIHTKSHIDFQNVDYIFKTKEREREREGHPRVWLNQFKCLWLKTCTMSFILDHLISERTFMLVSYWETKNKNAARLLQKHFSFKINKRYIFWK